MKIFLIFIKNKKFSVFFFFFFFFCQIFQKTKKSTLIFANFLFEFLRFLKKNKN